MRSALQTMASFMTAVCLACGGPAAPLDGSTDERDGGADASMVTACASHAHCDNGVYCDGPELCVPGDPAADGRGCTPGTPPCAATQACDEGTGRCLSDCDTDPDVDEDGYRATNCGGDDCDDSDPVVYVGAVEMCDAEGRDEDCRPNTLAGPAQTDVDGDGYVSTMCCNVQMTGALLCGIDCDDDERAANPGHPEVCDGIDNDCDGMIDEHVRATFYGDADGDLFGDPADTMEACVQPEGYVANGTDCDDGEISVNPSALEICNERDDDCDTMVDEDAPPGPDSCGACGLVCPAGWTCDAGTCEDRVVQVAAGLDMVCVRVATGRVLCWGPGPEPISEVPGITDSVQIAVGGGTACSVGATGEIACWGANFITGATSATASVVAVPGTVTQVSVGRQHACAVNSARAVYCWGQNDDGRLGDGTFTDRAAPTRVVGVNADQVSAGWFHTCARDGSTVRCWGDNASRQLGAATPTQSPTAVTVAVGATGINFVGSGAGTSCAGTPTGLWCWGANHRGQAGQSTFATTPVPPTRVGTFPSMSTIDLDSSSAIWSTGATSFYFAHTCAAVTDGRVFCWGDTPPTPPSGTYAYSPRQVPGVSGVTSITTGEVSGTGLPGTGGTYAFSCASTSDGEVWGWGGTGNDFLRTGNTGTIEVPARVIGLPPTTPPIPR